MLLLNNAVFAGSDIERRVVAKSVRGPKLLDILSAPENVNFRLHAFFCHFFKLEGSLVSSHVANFLFSFGTPPFEGGEAELGLRIVHIVAWT